MSAHVRLYLTVLFVKIGCLGTEFLSDGNKLFLEITLFVAAPWERLPKNGDKCKRLAR